VHGFAFKLKEHSCWVGIVGVQTRPLLGSDILTCVIAAVSASTIPHSSARSSESSLVEDSEDEHCQSDRTRSLRILGVVVGLLSCHRAENSALKGHSVCVRIQGCPVFIALKFRMVTKRIQLYVKEKRIELTKNFIGV
jgi:hypothetical protein